MLIQQIHQKIKEDGIRGLIETAFRRIFPRRLECYSSYKGFFEEKTGLEIGGPSGIFNRKGLIPVYPTAALVDNCTFSHQTVWEGALSEGSNFHFDPRKAPGAQYIVEASNLSRIASASYDFVLSSHVLEHVANPLQALAEWIRVLKEEGLLVLVVPHKDGTFDHLRPVTSLSHLIQDFERQTGEGDMTHLDEILRLHDLARDPDAGDLDAFKKRSMNNLENRCLHQHVFDTRLAIEVVNHMGLKILSVELFKPFHIVVVAQKLKTEIPAWNEKFMWRSALPCWTSPFPSDQPPLHPLQVTT